MKKKHTNRQRIFDSKGFEFDNTHRMERSKEEQIDTKKKKRKRKDGPIREFKNSMENFQCDQYCI